MAQQFTLNQSPDVHPFLSIVSKADATLKSQGNISAQAHVQKDHSKLELLHNMGVDQTSV